MILISLEINLKERERRTARTKQIWQHNYPISDCDNSSCCYWIEGWFIFYKI
jgi:hypothetical protein